MFKRSWLTVLVLVTVLALAFGITSAFANGGEVLNGEEGGTEGYCGGEETMEEMMGDWGMGGFHNMGLADPVTLERVAGTLGLTYEQLEARLAEGETIAQVAQAQGVDSSLVVATVLAPQSEILEVRVKYDYLSETQAQDILEQARLGVEQAITEPLYDHTSGCGEDTLDGMGRGMMGGGMMGSW